MTALTKDKLKEWIISVILVVITVLLTNYFTIRRETGSTIRQSLETKASIEYVNQQDNNIKDQLKQHTEQSNELMRSMDSKIDILLSRTK